MKEYYIASLIKNGILGGWIKADAEKIIYGTGKVTVTPDMKHIEMKYTDIQGYSFKRTLLFPVFSIIMNNGNTHRFIVFGSGGFRSLLDSKLNRRSEIEKED